jgi:ABC-type Fe3+-siderophore transport system permease subunit
VGAVVGSVVGSVVGAVVGSVAGAVVGVVTSSWVVPPAIGSSSSSVPAAHTVMGRQLRTRHRARTQLKKVLICFIYVPSFLGGSIYTVIIFQKIANFKQITFGTAGNIWKRK